MDVSYDPEDGSEKRSWQFDPEDLLTSEAIAIEKAYGEGSEQWLQALRTNEAKARRVLLWHLLRQEHRTLAFKDTPDFRKRQLQVQMNVAELRELASKIGRMKLNEDTKEQLTAAIEVDIRDAMEREGVFEGEIAEETPSLPKPH